MGSPVEKEIILQSLRPIFPQMNDVILGNCIDRVRQTVGEDRGLIIPGCIDVLLADPDLFAPLPPRNQPELNGRDFPGMAIVIEDEIPNHELTSPENSSISECEFDSESDDDLVYVATSLQRNGNEVFYIDDGTLQTAKTASIASPQTQRKESVIVVNPDPTTSPIDQKNLLSPIIAGVTPCGNRDLVHAHQSTPPTPLLSPPLISEPVMFDPIGHAMKQVKGLFLDVEDNFLRESLQKYVGQPPDIMINNVCNYLLENQDYPKKESKQVGPEKAVVTKDVDYLKEFSSLPHVSWDYQRQCEQLLENDFPTVSVRDIRSIGKKFNYHYAPTKECLEESLLYAVSNSSPKKSSPSQSPMSSKMNISGVQVMSPNPTAMKSPMLPGTSYSLKLLKSRRSQRHLSSLQNLEAELQKEVDFIKKHKRSKAEDYDRQLAYELNDKQYEEEGQKIECGCCYGDAAFEDMVQCLDGHLFCVDCLRNYAKEAVYGQGKATLSCMTAGCDSTFPLSQLKKSLTSITFSKYEDRLQEESLCLAEMDDLVRCPSCDFAAVVPPGNKVFKCQSTMCGKEICRFCKEDWAEHFGLKCSEVEKKSEKDVRLSYEEKMTMAKIRKCHKCGCEFTKSDGCNKMTCRCGTTMCYVCRKPGISYCHFCQHVRDPGQGCTTCSKCSLWTDPSEDDNMAIKQLEKEANEAIKQQMKDNDGNETPAKKARIE